MSCPKSGIRIRETNNNNNNNKNAPILTKSSLKTPVSFHTTTLDKLDLEISNYSLKDLYKLFNIIDNDLNESSLKQAKQVVLKMHPDKSQLEPKFFLFFSSAYKKLKEVYDFQNRSYKDKKYVNADFFEEENKELLNTMFQKPEFKDGGGNFNKWFNESFEKHRLENPNMHGYEDWLKSDEGFMTIDENVTQTNMNAIFERQKKQLQDVIVYNGISDSVSTSSIGGYTFDNNVSNYSSDNYTDLRQAYTETLIPVTEEDYNKMQKFSSLNEYKSHRDRVDITPLSDVKSLEILHNQKKEDDYKSASLAYKYALESEKIKKKQEGFWGELRNIKN